MPVFIPKSLPQNITVAEKQIRDILTKADGNGDGFLSKDELKEVFKGFGSKVPSWRAGRCLSKVDTNRDGVISREEFDTLVDYALAYKLKK